LSPRSLLRLLAAYLGVLLLTSIVLVAVLGVDRVTARPPETILSVWSQGQRRARLALKNKDGVDPDSDVFLRRETQATRGVRTAEDVIDTSPVLSLEPIIFGASFVPGRDGVQVSYEGRTAYATVDDLLALKAYDHPLELGPIRLQLGVDPDVVVGALAKELGVDPAELVQGGAFRRMALRHRRPPEPAPEVTPDALRDSALAAGRYLARAVRPDGSYRYEVNAIDNKESEGYNWPRHSGATWYLAESTIYARDPLMIDALGRAARRLAEGALVSCGTRRCIAEGDRADLGSSALGLLALSEIVEGNLMPELMPAIRDLADFLRSQQRADGEFMHFYDRQKNEPVDQQVLYYTGEASFALARAFRLTHDPKDLAAASRALERLVSYPAWYLARHYYFGAEHWTCHALEALWERAPNQKALDFCLEWQEAVSTTAIWDREASPEYDGATSAGPFVPPALVGTATRMEAGVATLRVARLAGVAAGEVEELEANIKKSLMFLLHFQHNPGPTQVMASPAAAHGGFPNTPTDFAVRIDYPQHAGTAIIGYLKLLEERK
jgi:hypothetical protein